MLITDHNKKHYVVIKSLRRLLSRQNSKHKESQHFCINCLQGFAERKSRDEQYVYCRSNEAVRIEMPNRKPIVQYSDGQYQFKVLFMMYADFESILEPIQGASYHIFNQRSKCPHTIWVVRLFQVCLWRCNQPSHPI